MSTIVVDEIQASGGGKPLKLPMKDGTAGQSLTTDGAGQLKFADAGGAAGGADAAVAHPIGQAFYGVGAGSYTWTCPPDVTKVHVVCIGGGSSSVGSTWANGAGAGGGLAWKNDIPVVPGTEYTVYVGKGGNAGGTVKAGGESYFIDSNTVWAGGGSNTTVGTFTGDGGGNGGSPGNSGGGGAGGYNGNGGNESADRTVAVAVVVVHIALLTVVLAAGEWDHLVKGHLVLILIMAVELVALVAKMV